MPLVTNIAQVIEVVNLSGEMEFSNLQPHIELASLIVQKHIDPTEYNTLNTTSITDATQLAIFNKVKRQVQFAEVNLAMIEFIQSKQIAISEMGVHINSSDAKKTAWQWQINDSKDSYESKAYFFLFEAQRQMFENPFIFTHFATSEIFIQVKKSFLKTPQRVETISGIQFPYRYWIKLKAIVERLTINELTQNFTESLILELQLRALTNDLTETDIILISKLEQYLTFQSILVSLNEGLRLNASGAIEVTTTENTTSNPYKQPTQNSTLMESLQKSADIALSQARAYVKVNPTLYTTPVMPSLNNNYVPFDNKLENKYHAV